VQLNTIRCAPSIGMLNCLEEMSKRHEFFYIVKIMSWSCQWHLQCPATLYISILIFMEMPFSYHAVLKHDFSGGCNIIIVDIFKYAYQLASANYQNNNHQQISLCNYSVLFAIHIIYNRWIHSYEQIIPLFAHQKS